MKEIKLFSNVLLVLFILTLSYNVESKPDDYFVGEWEVKVVGTPSGDAVLIVNIEQSEDGLKGAFKSEGANDIKINSIEIGENSITVYWQAEGYDVYMKLTKTDEDKIKGSLMDMFDASGTRIK